MGGDGDDDDITANFHGGNPRSVEAHEDTRVRKERDYQRILRTLHRHRPGGLTCDEVELLLGIPHQTCSARFSDLSIRKKWIRRTGEQRKTRTGSSADVWTDAPEEKPNA